MRIVGGEFRSRLIQMPRRVEIRPTQDKVRQAIFNVLGPIDGMRMLELFAGSGAVGIEALSRGASDVTFVDNNALCLNTIDENCRSLDISKARYELIHANALSITSRLLREDQKYDLIFLDPPYYKNIARKCLISIDGYDIVSPIGRVVVEHFKKDSLEIDLQSLVHDKDRVYGDTVVTFFRKIHEKT